MEGLETLAKLSHANRRRIGWACIGGTVLVLAGVPLAVTIGLGGLIVSAVGVGIQIVTFGCLMAIEVFHPTGAAAHFAEYGFHRVLAVMRPVAGLVLALWLGLGVLAPIGMIAWIVRQLLL